MEDPRAPNAPLAPDRTPAPSGGGDEGAALRVALVGAGYWGRNVARNLLDVPDTELLWVCDIDEIAAGRLVGRRSEVRVTSELDKMGYEQIPSQANFIMFDCKRPVAPLIQAMKERNVHVGRLFPALPNHMRLTIGKKTEMESFVSAFKQVTA